MNCLKKISLCLLSLLLAVGLTACGGTVTWNGETEELCELLMVIDFTDPYQNVGMVDYVFVGTVEGIDRIVIPQKRTDHDEYYSTYRIRVDRNLKGELAGTIPCSKMGGLRKDGTMLLVTAETPYGERIMDTGLPEVGKQYVFLAYAQRDGSLLLSEILDDRPVNEALLEEYRDYVANEIPYERQRFVSKYQP